MFRAMFVTDVHYDPVRDLTPVDQFGFIDLKSALDSSIVPSQMPDSDIDYNGMEDPNQVLGKPHDIFEAIDTQKAYEAAAAAGDADGKDDA